MAFFRHKVPKSQQPSKAPFTLFTPAGAWTNARTGIQVCSVDPARKNYAIRIEKWLPSGRIVPVAFTKVSVQEEADPEIPDSVCATFANITALLDGYAPLLAECHIFVVERQLPQNYFACRYAQHTLTYFMTRYAGGVLRPTILEVDPKFKTKALGAPKGLNEKQIKAWTISYARPCLAARGDGWSIAVMNRTPKKQDDLADTVCQVLALFVYWGIVPPPVFAALQATIARAEHEIATAGSERGAYEAMFPTLIIPAYTPIPPPLPVTKVVLRIVPR